MLDNKQIDYSKIDKKVEKIIKDTEKYLQVACEGFDDDCIKDEINKAYLFAKKAHEGQFRLSGDPYIIHPVEATKILLQIHPDIQTIQACLLHDVIEDTDVGIEEIEKTFGKDVAFLCSGMEKLSAVRYTGEDRDIGSLRKMFVAMAKDLRVIFIKLSDRIHNMKTLKFHPKKEKQIKIANETLNIYAPIADRLGLFNFKNILQEECFKILDKKNYSKIKKQLAEFKKDSKTILSDAEKEIKELLDKEGVKNYKIDYRIKSIYSIYKKLQKKGLKEVKSLYDIFGFRIIVDDIENCYRTLGIIHGKWSPLPNRFKDYIALPKPNGYKSLHTTIIGLLKKDKKQPAEIQIKTYEMLKFAEIGVAAHFEYKEKGSKVAKDIDWVNDLKELTKNLENNDFISSLKIDVFNHRIFVFTPKGDSIDLPAGSTAIDFAYNLHSDLGDHISIAKVNGKIYPLDKELHNGDIIEIIIDKTRKPNPFWLSFVKTNRAKNRIKNFLKKEDKDIHRQRGKEILNKYLEKSGLEILDKDLSLLKIIDGKSYKMEERWGLLEQIGNFSITASSLLKKILKPVYKKKESPKKIISDEVDKKIEIVIGGEEGLNYQIANCCKKSISDKIVAHIKSDGVFKIHNYDCKILKNVNKDRLLPAYIKGKEPDKIITKLKFIVKDEIGVLHGITTVLFNMGINIVEIIQKKYGLGQKEILLTIEILDGDYLLVDRFVNRVELKLGEKLFSKEILKIK